MQFDDEREILEATSFSMLDFAQKNRQVVLGHGD
jgi:hypothetical protein